MANMTLAWIALACAILSWLALPTGIVGLEIAALIMGAIVLVKAQRTHRRERRVAVAAIVLSVLKLVVYAALLIWIVIAFNKNPVAH